MEKFFQNTLYPLLSTTGILELLYVADGFGGVFFSSCKKIIISDCTFDRNTNKFAGVGYLLPHQENLFEEILIENSIFSNNRAGENSGVFWFSPNFIRLNCSIEGSVFVNNVAKSNFNFSYDNFFSGRCNECLHLIEYLVLVNQKK